MDLQKKNKPIWSLCVHGGMQREGIYFRDTFAPVVNWSTVRLTIMMAEMAGLE